MSQTVNEATADQTYLGDGVYAEFDASRYMIRLYTSDGVEQANEIFLDDHVKRSLMRFLVRHFEKYGGAS